MLLRRSADVWVASVGNLAGIGLMARAVGNWLGIVSTLRVLGSLEILRISGLGILSISGFLIIFKGIHFDCLLFCF